MKESWTDFFLLQIIFFNYEITLMAHHEISGKVRNSSFTFSSSPADVEEKFVTEVFFFLGSFLRFLFRNPDQKKTELFQTVTSQFKINREN